MTHHIVIERTAKKKGAKVTLTERTEQKSEGNFGGKELSRRVKGTLGEKIREERKKETLREQNSAVERRELWWKSGERTYGNSYLTLSSDYHCILSQLN